MNMNDKLRSLLLGAAGAAAILVTGQAAALEPLPAQPPVPADNPLSAAKIELGRMLYFDPRLSVDGSVSCNSCHNVMTNGTDNRRVSVGVKGQRGGRSAPTVFNAAFLTAQFWDGRAATLEDQAKGPILNPVEMGMPSEAAVLERLGRIPGYVARFAEVFGENGLTYDNVAKAIAAYERTLITPNSPFDRYMRGDKSAMGKEALRGMKLVDSVGCTACHNGPNFAGPVNLPPGQGFFQKFPTFTNNDYVKKYDLMADTGLHSVTGKAADKHMWRVPTWRNVALTAPYFHNGSVKTLDEAVRVMAKTQLNKELRDKDVRAIVAFLNSLTGEIPPQTLPRLPQTANMSVVGSSK